MSAADRLMRRLDRVKQTGAEQWMARCPAHDDRTPSLSIKQADDRLLVHCFAGCEVGDVLAAAGLGLGDLYDKPLSHHRAALKPYQRQRRGQAMEALQVLRLESLVVLIAADRMAAGYGLTWDDLDRLHTAFERILEGTKVCGAKPEIPNSCPELKRPSDYRAELHAEFGHEGAPI